MGTDDEPLENEDRGAARWAEYEAELERQRETEAAEQAPSKAAREADRLIGGRMPEPTEESALDGLESHLRATGAYSPEGSVWQQPTQGQEAPGGHESWPKPGVGAEPPPYDGPGAEDVLGRPLVRRGIHRRPRRSFWRWITGG